MFAYRIFGSLVVCLTAFLAAALQAESADGVDVYGDPLPPGAVSRLGTVRFRSHSNIHAATFSADGKRLIGVTNEGLLYWDMADGRLVASLPSDRQNIQQTAVSLDGRWACADGFYFDEDKLESVYTLRVWDLENRELKRTIENTGASSLALAADGSLVAAGTNRGEVRVYEVASGEEILSYTVAEGQIAAISFSPDTRQITVGGRRMGLFVWDWDQGTEPKPLEGFEGAVGALAFSPDGELLAASGDISGGLSVWRTGDWSKVEALDFGELRSVNSITFSPDSSLLAASSYVRETAIVWDVATGELVRSLPMRPEANGKLAFSLDGKWLVAANENHNTPPRIWNLETGDPHEAVVRGHWTAPSAIKFLPNDETIVTAGDDGTARIWDAATGRQLRTLSHHPDHVPDRQYNVWIRGMAASDDGRFIATSSLDESVRLWDAASAEEVYRLPGHGRLGGRRALAFTPDGSKLV